MNNKKIRSYFISGLFLAYFGLEDIGNFNIIYNGIPTVFSAVAFMMVFVEYRKQKNQEPEEKN